MQCSVLNMIFFGINQFKTFIKLGRQPFCYHKLYSGISGIHARGFYLPRKESSKRDLRDGRVRHYMLLRACHAPMTTANNDTIVNHTVL